MAWRRLADFLYRRSSLTRAKQQGFEFGVVVDVEDPWKLGRIRVRFPWHYDGDMSDWALPASGTKSDNTGSTFDIPQVDDLVLCVFYGGDVTRPAYLGSVWTGGGIGPRGQIKPRKTLVKGYEPQAPDPKSYDPNVQPNLDPKPYPEPPEGAWVSNDPKTRVNEFKTYGGLRVLWEEMKRRLRLFTHPTTPFKLTVEHFDSDSVDPPRATPYHNAKYESPNGTFFQVEEDVSAGNYITRLTHHSGLQIIYEYLGSGNSVYKITIQDPGGERIVIDELLQQIVLMDRKGGTMKFDAVNLVRQINDAAGNTIKLDENAIAIEVTTPGNITLNATGTLTLHGTAGVNITSDGSINIG